MIAGAKQGNPVTEWRTNISKLLSSRLRRNIAPDKTVMTKAKTIYKCMKRNITILPLFGRISSFKGIRIRAPNYRSSILFGQIFGAEKIWRNWRNLPEIAKLNPRQI